jgi:hypothetical protein
MSLFNSGCTDPAVNSLEKRDPWESRAKLQIVSRFNHLCSVPLSGVRSSPVFVCITTGLANMSKKTAKTPKEVSSYEFRDVVLGKVRGYPPWPGMVSQSRALLRLSKDCSQS